MKKLSVLMISSALFLIGCPPPPKPNAASATPIDAASVAQIQTGVAVAVILDASGSMSGGKLITVKNILKSSIKDKLTFYSVMGEGSLHLSLIKCGGGPYTLLPMSEYQEDSFLAIVNDLSSSGGTPLADSVKSAYQELTKSGCKDKHIFILSDGAANNSDDVARALKENSTTSVQIHVIGFQTDEANYKEFVKAGGQVIMADDAKTLDSTTNSIFKGILKLEAE